MTSLSKHIQTNVISPPPNPPTPNPPLSPSCVLDIPHHSQSCGILVRESTMLRNPSCGILVAESCAVAELDFILYTYYQHFFRLDKAYLQCTQCKSYILARCSEDAFLAFSGEPCCAGPLDAALWHGHITHTMCRQGSNVECTRARAQQNP